MRIDLHLHSTRSDGTLPPDRLVEAARQGGLDVIALADHDTARGVAEAERAAAGIVHVVPAIEVSSTLDGRDLHFLGYFIDHRGDVIRRYGKEATRRRADRIRGMIERLAPLGIDIEYEHVVRVAGADTEVLARPHLAQAMLETGAVRSFGEAFNRFIGDDGPAFLPTDLLTPETAIDLIHRAGGVAVWAHPPLDTLRTELPRFIEWGLDGVECYRPRLTPSEVETGLEITRTHGLFPTGGSDWHGEWHGRLGDFAVTPDEVQQLLDIGGL